MAWYENHYRRHLCDMHIDDWDESFLSRFSPEAYAQNLADAHINAPMLYFQSHVGYCYYPTKNGRIHRAFEKEPDKMRRLVELCHARGMKVVGYYSLNYNTWAHDVYPAWRMLEANGKSRRENAGGRYGLCCPNNADYRAFVFEQIKEMLDYFTVEGMFYDMPFWPHVCLCDACRARWEKEVGGDMPTETEGAAWELLLAKRREWMGEWAQAVTDYTKSICPEVSVEQNFACAVASGASVSIGDEVNEACDYTGGDLYGGLLEQSFTCKYYISASRNQPFEYMTCRCDPNLQKHTITKSKRELETAVMLTCAHHGASLIIDAIDPVGTLDARVYKLLGEVFDSETPYERYLTGDLLADVGVVYHLPSKALRRGQTFCNHEGALQAAKTLMGAHVPVGVVTYRQKETLKDWPIIIAPLVHSLSDEERNALISYVRLGGKLYFSGAEEPLLVQALLGAQNAGFTEHTVTYLAPEKPYEALFDGFNEEYPLPFDLSVPRLVNVAADAEILARVKLPYTTQKGPNFSSIHSNPPGIMTDIPAVIRRKVGQGEVIFSAMPIEKEPVAAYGRVLCNLLGLLGLNPSVRSDVPRGVELVTFRESDAMRVSAVRLDGESWVIPPFEVRVRADRAPSAVTLLPGGESVAFDYADGSVRFQSRPLDLFAMYEIRL